jgi:hypothetical protein
MRPARAVVLLLRRCLAAIRADAADGNVLHALPGRNAAQGILHAKIPLFAQLLLGVPIHAAISAEHFAVQHASALTQKLVLKA